MTRPNEALEVILAACKRSPVVSRPLAELPGYVLAEDIIASDNLPPFDNSAMDGYAVLADDIAGAGADNPIRLELVEEQPAGKATKVRVLPGTAIKIMTGAPIPLGADTVIQIELTRAGAGTVEILSSLPSGSNIRRAGEDMVAGTTAISTGTVVDHVAVAILAGLGRSQAAVFSKPKVAVIGTGNELVAVEEPLTPGKIRDSNSYALTAQALACGADAMRLGVAGDTKAEVHALAALALSQADVVVTSGGVSVGDYDFVKDVLAEMGAELKFWGVKQKPGKPLAFWLLDDKLIFGLPGNPVASIICFEEYVRPALLKMMGRNRLRRRTVQAELTHDLKKKPGRQHFVGVRVEETGGRYLATVNGKQGSGMLRSIAGANGIGIIREEAAALKAGDPIEVQLITMPESE